MYVEKKFANAIHFHLKCGDKIGLVVLKAEVINSEIHVVSLC